MPKKSGQTAMAQPTISNFTSRVTRRTARIKTASLDLDNENIISIAPTKDLLKSPKRLQKSISVQESSPAKIPRKTAEVKEQKPKARGSRRKTPPPQPTETIQETFRKQLELLKSPIKPPVTPDKFRLNIIDISPPKDKIPTIRRALKFDEKSKSVDAGSLPFIAEDVKPTFAGQVKRDRAVNSQPNSPSTASPHTKKRITVDQPVSSKELLNSPQRPSTPLGSPRKVETRTRAQIMLEEIVGKKKGIRNLSKDLLKKQLEKSGRLNEIKSKLAEVKDIDARLKAVREKSPKKSTIGLKVRPAPTPLDVDAPCYVKYRHLVEPGAMEKMRLPSHYDMLANQFETTDSQTATLYNRGEAGVFEKISNAVRQVHKRDFGINELGQVRAVYPECYTYTYRKGLYDAKKGSRIKSAEHQLVISPILENDENDSEPSGALRMSLKHITKRTQTFRQTLIGIVKDLHEQFLTALGLDVSKMKQIKRWHPQFGLEQCAALKSAPLPKRPGTESAPTSATKLLEMMKDRFPAQATEKLEARKKELEVIELKKIEKEKTDEEPTTQKSKIPAHILAKIRAKQAAKAEAECSQTVQQETENNLLEIVPKAASIIRSHFITEKKTCYPFDSACKKLQRSWKTPISIGKCGEMLEKLYEIQPKWLEVRIVVGTKYCKLLDRDLSPIRIEEICKKKMNSI